MDGVVLADALTKPIAKQQRAQDEVAASLASYQQAIVARSLADVQSQSGVTAPPPKST
jgi:hypothetical protein